MIALAVSAWCAPAAAQTCNQSPEGNTIIFGCNPFASTCIISGNNGPAGCELDFGTRKVVFQGNFNVGSNELVVRAGQIEVRGSLKARPDGNTRGGSILLTSLDAIVVTGTIDASGNSGGLMRLQAGGAIDLQSTALLRARGVDSSSTGNAASGGRIELTAGTFVSHRGILDLSGGNDGAGGSLQVIAGTDAVLTQPIVATGGSGDGGDVDVVAGDDVTVSRKVDVSSTSGGAGGSISARAGIDGLGGLKIGGTLVVAGDLVANGDRDQDGGYDGGDITLRAFGPALVSGNLTAVGGSPDGGGGSVTIDSSDNLPDRVTALDGDLKLSSTIDVHGPNVGEGGGGDVDLFAGRDARITGSMDLSGSDGGGDLTLFGGRTVDFGASVNARGTVVDASGGSITIVTGRASLGALTVTRSLDVSAPGVSGSVSLAGCSLTLAPALTVNAKTGSQAGAPHIDLVSVGDLTVGAGGTYRADPLGRVALIHPASVVPRIGTNVAFSPGAVTLTESSLFPACPVCGDGIRQDGEPCDKGLEADGACCNDTCTALTCPTPSPPPTATPGATAKPTVPRHSPTRTPGSQATTPMPTTTPILQLVRPKPVVACERMLGKATTTLALGTLRAFETCALDAFKCVQTHAAGRDRDACYVAGRRRCNAKLGKLDDAHARFRAQLASACGGDPPAVPADLMRSTDVLGFSLLQPQCFGLDLASPDLIIGCLQILSPCEIERVLGIGIPRVTELLNVLSPGAADSTCLPTETHGSDGLDGSPIAGQTIRCQRTVATEGRRLLTRQIGVARACVDALFKCRVTDKPGGTCAAVAAACARKLSALDDPTTGARGKMLAAVHAACSTLPADIIRGGSGIGFDAIAQRCAALGVDPPLDASSMARCVARAYGCAGSNLVRQALPLVDHELGRMGLALGDDTFCGLTTPTPTPAPSTATPTRSPSAPAPTITIVAATVVPSPTATPTMMATGEPPTPTPEPTVGCPNGILESGEQCDFGDDVPGDGCDPLCRFDVLLPGGGLATQDCIGEWAVINPYNVPRLDADGLPNAHQSCVDGDPTCDADDTLDGRCTFRVAVCFQNTDPNLPTCSPPRGIAKYVLTSPRPNSADPGDAANALALLSSFGRLSGVAPTGNSKNTLVFDPPLVVADPDNCTETALLVVDRRGYRERSEKFRTTTTSAPQAGQSRGIDDDDTLLLTCRAAAEPTSTRTPAAVPAATPTPGA